MAERVRLPGIPGMPRAVSETVQARCTTTSAGRPTGTVKPVVSTVTCRFVHGASRPVRLALAEAVAWVRVELLVRGGQSSGEQDETEEQEDRRG